MVNRNRSICFEEKEMRNWTFQNADEENRLIKIAKDYVANWEEMKRNHMVYLLWDR